MKAAWQLYPTKTDADVVEETHRGYSTQHLEMAEVCAEFVAKAAKFEAEQSSPEEARRQLKIFAAYIAAEYGTTPSCEFIEIGREQIKYPCAICSEKKTEYLCEICEHSG